MKWVKKNKNIIIGIIVLIIVICAALGIKWLFFGNSNSAIYGNRLEGINKVKITREKQKKVQDSVANGRNSVKIRLQGRIINLIFTVDAETTLEEAKALGQTAVDQFTEEEKKYYDIQIFVLNDKNSQFPIIGYKHHAATAIIWTKDRTEN